MGNKSDKISIRITPWQGQVLSELSQATGASYSMIIRTIIGSWLTQNEEYVYRIIDRKKIGDADNSETRKEEKIF